VEIQERRVRRDLRSSARIGEDLNVQAAVFQSAPRLVACTRVNGESDIADTVRRLVDDYRDQCLWFLRRDFYPDGVVETLRTLDYIERYGDQRAFRRAAAIRRWLSRPSSGPADTRIASGESYVAGGAALNELLAAPRLSRDIDLFHDTDAALQASWDADRALLGQAGFQVTVLRERPGLVEARVARQNESVRVECARDSAFRFFPLVQHPDLGLVLHPFDLATNKALALVGCLEPRDWIDVLECDARLQPLGYLAWAASGKDPGFSPQAILGEATRSGRYSAAEIGTLDFSGHPPDAAALSRRWHALLDSARHVVAALPAEEVGCCVLTDTGELFRGDPLVLRTALDGGRLRFHPGSIRGALPRVVDVK